jgi:hypothetical protein
MPVDNNLKPTFIYLFGMFSLFLEDFFQGTVYKIY